MDRTFTTSSLSEFEMPIMLIGCRGLQTVRQATLGIDTDMSLHAEVPLIAFLGLPKGMRL